ncbi:MAG: cohesin domain-containing protein, partial [Candidatus Bathyarchaeota archaeon]|nr:cohesin domain-containing protein [Candidatus Bathyarchaeota archaeon]
MKLKMEKAISILLTSTLLLSLFMALTPSVFAQTTIVRFFPQPSPQAELTSNGQTFTVACVVEDVTNLYGLDIQIAWNTTYLEYVSHEKTGTVEDYPNPIPPSPYAGIIHAAAFWLKDDVNETAGTYWLAGSSLAPAPSFNGSGTAFVMTFRAINLPFGDPLQFFYTYLNFVAIDLAAGGGGSLGFNSEDGVIKHWYLERVIPPWPLLKIDPVSYEASALGEVFDYDVWLLGAGDTDLDPYWDVGGIDVYMNFNSTLIKAIDITIDPDGNFTDFWPHGGIFVTANDTDNVAGTAHVAFIGYGEPHTAPYGQIKMFSVTFNVTYESTEYPPPSAPVTLKNPTTYTGAFTFDSIGGLINIADPVGTTYYELVPDFLAGPFEMLSWEDNGDGVLSPSDQFILNDTTTGFYFDYHLTAISGTLN